MSGAELLFLSEEDTIAAGLLDMRRSVDNAREAFQLVSRGDYRMGGPSGEEHGQRIFFPEAPVCAGMPAAAPGYSFMAMPVYVGGRFHMCGEKWYGANPLNLTQGLPRAYHMVMLNDVETGRPLSLLTATLLSAVRSGAAPAVAVEALQGRQIRTAAMIGAGLMNRAVVLALEVVCPELEDIRVFDLQQDKCLTWCEEMQKHLKTAVLRPVDSVEDAFRGADIVHTGQSSSFHIKREWVKEGALLLISSFLSMDDALLQNANIIFDHKSAHDVWLETDPAMGLPTFDALRLIRSGAVQGRDVYDLGELVTGTRIGQGKPYTVFYWMGMSVSDIALATDLYRAAFEQGIGTGLPLWSESFWK